MNRVASRTRLVWVVRHMRTGLVVGYFTGPMPEEGSPFLYVERDGVPLRFNLNWCWQEIRVPLAAAMHRVPGFTLREMSREAANG